ncbi:MAG TPA: response regulator, partial [Anaeromyxobacteraceae bacterium]
MSPARARLLAPAAPRVLVVEDEGIVAADIALTLEGQGYSVGTAASADEALAEAERAPADVVVMDIRLEGKGDGVWAADRLRQRFGVPVVFLTAHGDPETVARAMAAGPHGYLVKPFRPTELLTAVEVALSRDALERGLRERER